MSTTKISLTIAILLSLLTVWGCQSTGNPPGNNKKDVLAVDKKKDVSGQSDPTSE